MTSSWLRPSRWSRVPGSAAGPGRSSACNKCSLVGVTRMTTWHLLVPEEHIFQKAIKPSKPHTCCMIYKYITAPNMAKRVAINNPKSHGDLGSPVPLPKVKNVCSVFWFFFFKLCSWFASVPFLFSYSTEYMSDFTVTLLGHANEYRMGMEGRLKLLGLSKSCLVNIFHFSLP